MENLSIVKQTDYIELTPELEQRIKAALTPQCAKVLMELYGRRLTNKEYAKRLHTTTSALSNNLLKIKNTGLDLLEIEQNGRNTYYSLSELGTAYVANNLLQDNAGKVINIEERMSGDVLRAMQAIKAMQKAWGEEWDFRLDELLMYYSRGDYAYNEDEFTAFTKAVRNVIIEGRMQDLKKIYSFIGEDFLQKRIEKCFEQLMGITFLCILDEGNWKLAYRVVEDFFENGGKSVQMDVLESLQQYQIGVEQLKSVFRALTKMVDEAQSMRKSKEEFCNEWERPFGSHEKLVYHIAGMYGQKGQTL